MNSTGGEQGLLGLAFHPDYATNGYFYVHYVNMDTQVQISRFSVEPADPDVADPDSELEMITFPHPFLNHNGGDMNFGPDGYLYDAMGDGGGSGHNNGQDITGMLLGKLLRLDVDGDPPYEIPADNPFVGETGDDELWCFGLRNPWRFSFDRLTGDIWIGDVGASTWEEINFQPTSSNGGENYGWKCFEAFDTVNSSGVCDSITVPITYPIFIYPHEIGTGGYSVTGGFVYRGTQYPGMYGYYMFCDYVSGNWWITKKEGSEFNTELLGIIRDDIPTFGEGVDGEIYCADLNSGQIYHVTDACGNFSLSFNVTDASAPTTSNGSIDLSLTGGSSPFTYDWSNGATIQDISGLSAGTYSVTVTDNEGCTTTDSAVVSNACTSITSVNTGVTSNSAILDWDDVGATKYKIAYKPTGGGTPLTTSTTGTIKTLTGLTPSTNYIFRINHKCPGAPGNFSYEGSFSTESPKLAGDQLFDASITIYPNPGDGMFKVDGISAGTSISIFDIAGKKLGDFELNENRELNLMHFEAGVYFVQFLSNQHPVSSKKIVISK